MMRSELISTGVIESWAASSRGVIAPATEEKTFNDLVTAFSGTSDPRYHSPSTPSTEEGDLQSSKANSPMSLSSSRGDEDALIRPPSSGVGGECDDGCMAYDGHGTATEVSTLAGSSDAPPPGMLVNTGEAIGVADDTHRSDRFFLIGEKSDLEHQDATNCLIGTNGTQSQQKGSVKECGAVEDKEEASTTGVLPTMMSHKVQSDQSPLQSSYTLLPAASDQDQQHTSSDALQYNETHYSTPRSLLSMNYLPPSRALESPTSYPQSLTAYQSSIYPQSGQPSNDSSNQKAVAFLAGPRERICVLGNPIEICPRCRQEGFSNSSWRPHRHIGELKIRYICERHFEDLESPHHFDIPLCPLCNNVLYLYEFNALLGVSNARRLHKYVLKCSSRHVLPLLDLFCQTKKGGDRCNANFKLQWCYGTMVKRCESQKNRDHDLWWVRYKNEWKQRRTIIRYKKDFLSHLSDTQRGLLLGIGLEGEPPPDPKGTLGPTFDALISSSGGSPTGPKIKKRGAEKMAFSQLSRSSIDDEYGEHDINQQYPSKRRQGTDSMFYANPALQAYSLLIAAGLTSRPAPPAPQSSSQSPSGGEKYSLYSNASLGGSNVDQVSPSEGVVSTDKLVNSEGTYRGVAGADSNATVLNGFPMDFAPNQVITGTPMNDLQRSPDGRSPVAVSVTGDICPPAPSRPPPENSGNSSRERAPAILPSAAGDNIPSLTEELGTVVPRGTAAVIAELSSPI